VVVGYKPGVEENGPEPTRTESEVFDERLPDLRALIEAIVKVIPEGRTCACGSALKGASRD